MRTSVKVTLAAIGAAVVAYPVMAANWRDGYIQPDLSTNNVFWGMPYPAYRHYPTYEHPAYGHPYGYGSVAHHPPGRAYGYEPVAHPPAGHPYGYGPFAHPPAGRLVPGGTVEAVHPPIIDCVHVPFPQCSGGN
jgi:hypothetical protein